MWFKNDIFHKVAKLWNDLPFQIDNISELDVQDFRSILKWWKGVDFEGPSYHCV